MINIVEILETTTMIITDGTSSPVIIVNELGIKGDKGDKGDQGEQGSEYHIVNTYADMIELPVTNKTVRALVMADEQNNSGNTSEYIKHINGVIMWQASINIEDL